MGDNARYNELMENAKAKGWLFADEEPVEEYSFMEDGAIVTVEL